MNFKAVFGWMAAENSVGNRWRSPEWWALTITLAVTAFLSEYSLLRIKCKSFNAFDGSVVSVNAVNGKSYNTNLGLSSVVNSVIPIGWEVMPTIATTAMIATNSVNPQFT